MHAYMALLQFDEEHHAVFSWQDSCTAEEISHFISIEQIPLVTKLNQEVCTLIPCNFSVSSQVVYMRLRIHYNRLP